MRAWRRLKVGNSCWSGWETIQRATSFGCGIQVIIRSKNITPKPCWFNLPLKLMRAPAGEAFSKAACYFTVISAPANPVPRRLKNFKMCWLRLWALWHCVWVCLWDLTSLSLSVGLRTAWSISSCGRLGCGSCSCPCDTAGHPSGERSSMGVRLRNGDVTNVLLMVRIDKVNLYFACNPRSAGKFGTELVWICFSRLRLWDFAADFRDAKVLHTWLSTPQLRWPSFLTALDTGRAEALSHEPKMPEIAKNSWIVHDLCWTCAAVPQLVAGREVSPCKGYQSCLVDWNIVFICFYFFHILVTIIPIEELIFSEG